MIKSELAHLIAIEVRISKTLAREIINLSMKLIIKSLANGDHVQLLGFGSFFLKTRKGRIIKLPNSTNVINVPDRKTVKFIPGKKFIQRLNKVR